MLCCARGSSKYGLSLLGGPLGSPDDQHTDLNMEDLAIPDSFLHTHITKG